MKKRILSLTLSLALALSMLAGCSGKTDSSTASTDSNSGNATSGTVTEAAEPVEKDPSKTYSIDDKYEPWVWEVAVNNENFRKAIFYGVSRASTYSVNTGTYADPYTYIQNTITPSGFAVDENGVDYTDYPAFQELQMQDFFDQTAALIYRDQAMTELAAEGVSFPVKVLVRYNPSTTNWEEECTVLKAQLEAVLNGDGVEFIDVEVEAGPSENFLSSVRRSSDYMLLLCNWGADYADPETYTDPFYQAEDESRASGYDRGMRYAYLAYSISDDQASSEVVQEYFNLVEAAKAITDDTEARYTAFAEAESYLINHALAIPYGTSVSSFVVSRLNPWEGQYAAFGVSSMRYKGQHLLDDFLTMEQYEDGANGQITSPYTDTDDDTYRVLYSGELTTLNYLTTSNSNEQTVGANVIDTLVEYDSQGEVQPSLATDWEYDSDTCTWTFHLRDNATWVDTNGNVVAKVTAQDFVDSMKYILDPSMGSSTVSLIFGIIDQAEEYYEYLNYLGNAEAGVVDEDGTTYTVDEAGIVTVTDGDGVATTYEPVDFEAVGVKAVDDTTLQYTLTGEVPYFLSMMTYVVFMPAYGPQLEELGANFATSADTMYYCGAYYLSSYKPQVELVYSKNTNNWDAEHVYIETIRKIYNAEASTIGAEMARRGEIDYTTLSADVVDAWLADASTANMVSMERPAIDYSYFYCFNFNVYALDDSFYR
jgi:ABC-type oligopeptide transport system substrate-binding subunit